MKIVLFCENLYSLSILQPIQQQAQEQHGNTILWYMHQPKIALKQIPDNINWTYSIQEIYDFKPDAIFVPGNIVPYYLPGVKIQIFHGYAAEKKGHYVMRKYFDLYLTQGPAYTAPFEALARKYTNFKVIQTGWSRKDLLIESKEKYAPERQTLLKKFNKKKIVLYAPTFSPKLTSLFCIKEKLTELIHKHEVLLVIKLHPLTSADLVQEYKELSQQYSERIIFADEPDSLIRYQIISDIMISDTSSVVYEFTLLRKPVITLCSIAQQIYWHNILSINELIPTYEKINLQSKQVTDKYLLAEELLDPYTDARSSTRMLEAAQSYISQYGVPSSRKVNLWRKYTSIKKFGRIKKQK